MNICILGSGNVATHIAKSLDKEEDVVAIYSKTLAHASLLTKCLRHAVPTDSLASIPNADIYLFALKDSVLAEVIASMKNLGIGKDALWVHTAGSMPLSVFEGINYSAVLYPMQTFSKKRTINFKEVPLFIEANNIQSSHIIETLAKKISDHVTWLDSDKRRYLHLSAVFANNFTNHCCTLAFKLLESQGIEGTTLLPLIDETIKKLHTMSPQQAQTGPAVRWDENVISNQVKLLDGMPGLQQVYTLLTQSIHQCKNAKTLDHD